MRFSVPRDQCFTTRVHRRRPNPRGVGHDESARRRQPYRGQEHSMRRRISDRRPRSTAAQMAPASFRSPQLQHTLPMNFPPAPEPVLCSTDRIDAGGTDQSHRGSRFDSCRRLCPFPLRPFLQRHGSEPPAAASEAHRATRAVWRERSGSAPARHGLGPVPSRLRCPTRCSPSSEPRFAQGDGEWPSPPSRLPLRATVRLRVLRRRLASRPGASTP